MPEPSALVEEGTRALATDGRISIYDRFVPEGSSPSLGRRAMNPLARVLFADLNRRLEPLAAPADLELAQRSGLSVASTSSLLHVTLGGK